MEQLKYVGFLKKMAIKVDSDLNPAAICRNWF